MIKRQIKNIRKKPRRRNRPIVNQCRCSGCNYCECEGCQIGNQCTNKSAKGKKCNQCSKIFR